MKRCLYCYKELDHELTDYHPQCSKKIYGSAIPPILPYSRKDLVELAEKVVRSQVTLTGVQSKLSLDIEDVKESSKRFTIVGLWGRYILRTLCAVTGIRRSDNAFSRDSQGKSCSAFSYTL